MRPPGSAARRWRRSTPRRTDSRVAHEGAADLGLLDASRQLVTSLFHHITTRSGAQRRKLLPTKRFRSVNLRTTTLSEPGRIVRPPGVRVLLSGVPPLVGILDVDRAGAERCLGVAWRVDQRSDVTVGGQDVAVVFA